MPNNVTLVKKDGSVKMTVACLLGHCIHSVSCVYCVMYVAYLTCLALDGSLINWSQSIHSCWPMCLCQSRMKVSKVSTHVTITNFVVAALCFIYMSSNFA